MPPHCTGPHQQQDHAYSDNAPGARQRSASRGRSEIASQPGTFFYIADSSSAVRISRINRALRISKRSFPATSQTMHELLRNHYLALGMPYRRLVPHERVSDSHCRRMPCQASISVTRSAHPLDRRSRRFWPPGRSTNGHRNFVWRDHLELAQ
jgi:hypothetical protein